MAPTPIENQKSKIKNPSFLLALAILLGTLCIIVTVTAISHQSPFSEHLSLARRCVELNDCPSRGGGTGAFPLFHGASWIRLLSHSLRAGHDLTWVQSVVLGSWIVSIPITFFFLMRYLGLRAAVLALGLYFPVILAGTDVTRLSYTNLLPLPFAVYYASIALLVEFRRAVCAAVASVALAAGVSAELASIAMLPFHFFLVALTAQRPLLALAVSASSFAIAFCLDSMDAAREIVRQVPTIQFAIGLAVSGGVAALGAWMKPQALLAASVPVADRVRTVMSAALVYATVTIWLASLVLMQSLPEPRYFVPASFPFLYLLAEGTRHFGARTTFAMAGLASLCLLLLLFAGRTLELVEVFILIILTLYALRTIVRQVLRYGPPFSPARSLWPSVAIFLVAMLPAAGNILMLSKRGVDQTLTLAEVERLVPKLYWAGYTYTELLGSLQGAAADDLMSLLSERDPKRFDEPRPYLADPDFSLLVLKVPNTAVSQARGVIAAVPAGGSHTAIVIRGERSVLDWTRVRRCTWNTGESQAVSSYACAEPRTDRPLPHNWPYVEFGEPIPIADGRSRERVKSHTVHYEVPVQTPGQRQPRILRVSNQWPATWRIVGVRGVEFEGELPAEEIRLPDTENAAGLIEFQFTGPVPSDLPWFWIPPVMEVAEENEHLLGPFRSR